MDPAGLDPDAPVDVGAAGLHTGVRSESVAYGSNGVDTHGMRNGSHAMRDEQLQHVMSNGNGAGAIALPRPGTLGEIKPAAEPYLGKHGLIARGVKRTFDVVGALLMIAILAPLWLVIAFLIKADSPGPILFRQRRIGKDGKTFWMLKFRTMVDGADARKPALLHLNEAGEGLFKIGTDPRVTRVGRWMRSTCLDELPQLLHVLTGQMSLVGPRPLVPEEDSQITGRDRHRLSVRPGMTGVWQVGGASAIPINEMVALDRAYVENWSPWVDLKLLAETVLLVVLRKGL
jgi:lipopolysaccharide/colanic/teichoic acid biosynthesis glycosyltransferase